ncbi:RNA pyrophosphohydrolase [bacterium]|nr:RNA pyrophosphohydrolase [bacterium]
MRTQMTPINNAFRPNVGLVVMNGKGLFWTGERLNFKGSWQWPQGGIDSGETPRDAAWRELREETGLTEEHVELVAETPVWLTYEVPRTRPTFFGYRGQTQKWFLFRYKGADEEAKKLAMESEDFQKEFSDFKWQTWEAFYPLVVGFKQPLYVWVKKWIDQLEKPNIETELSFDSFIWKGAPDDIEMVRTSLQYANWIKRMDQRFKIEEIRVQAVDRRHNGGLLFAKLFVKAFDQEGRQVPGAVLLRGDASAVLIVINCEGEKYTVIVRQPRFAAGLYETKEIPAGMLDDSTDKLTTAIREVKEETGIDIPKENVTDLGGFFPTYGISDEIIFLFSAEIDLTKEALESIKGRICGCPDENEKIRVEIIPLKDLSKVTDDPKSLMAYWRYLSKNR